MAEPEFLETHPSTRVCAWTGDEFEGKAYIFTTTEGPEIVSPAALFEGSVPGWHVDNVDAEQRAIEEKAAAEKEAAAKAKKTAGLQKAAGERRAANKAAASRTRKPPPAHAPDDDTDDDE
jgi:hypothetical protein